MFVSIDEQDSRPIYQQIVSQVREQVSQSLLAPGDELPSVRELSDSLGINMHTVRRAYVELRDQGIISMRLGRRARITGIRPASAGAVRDDTIEPRLKELVTDALLSGMTAEEFKAMVDRQFEK